MVVMLEAAAVIAAAAISSVGALESRVARLGPPFRGRRTAELHRPASDLRLGPPATSGRTVSEPDRRG